MEITKEIIIEGNLIKKSKIKLYYKGKFTREYSNEVFITYGYGLEWKNIKEQKMTWMNDCFFVEIFLEDFGTLNFCFKNDFGSWDNNNGQDYTINIEDEKEEIFEISNVTEIQEEVFENPDVVEFQEEVLETNENNENLNDVVENNEIQEKAVDVEQRVKKFENIQYTKRKKEKFKRSIDKKNKKGRQQKKFEKNRTFLNEVSAISNDEESLFEFTNNNKVIKKEIVFDNIMVKELSNVKRKPKRKTKKDKKSNYKRYKRNKIRDIIRNISLLILVGGIIYVSFYHLEKIKVDSQTYNLLNTVKIDESTKKDVESIEDIVFEETERMLQVRELNNQYPDLKGWIEIEGTNINYPLMQGTDNDFYIKHDYKKEYSRWGSLFLDKAYDWSIPSSNLLVYGHNFSDGVMLSDLLKYADKSFYDAHPVIKVTTPNEDAEYEIIAVFYSRLYYKSETNVFRYYFFVNAENEAAYNEFVNNAKAASIYDTGKTATYGDQLLTLSTCEYSQEDGRFAVVARKIK